MLQIQGLNKTFSKNTANCKQVFDNFSLKVNKGDFITIIGSNGAGKSTLLNLISGKLSSDSGSILLKDMDLTKMSEHKASKNIARVFQNPTLGTAPSMTILENMSLAIKKGRKYGFSFCVSKSKIPYFKEILSQAGIGLENHLYTKVGLLSGGQRQALTIIMATMVNPDILLLDEPTAALDPKTSKKICGQIEKIVDEKKITTLMVTHDLNQAIEVGNRLLMMHDGRVVLDIDENEKKNLTIDKLLDCFEKSQDKGMLSDRMLFSY
ncbi:ABC transporter ATP-binding protein [Abyssisolibacter fermentans]|uniref:ABC transporter ATP-binding protein n=1 Tax=Abyssisolibacter fermentans TaxID=1766203 RepID=UPI00082A7D3C|nr:ATP-binding cassette domain-containing protein [Abyssisolibacter fermentans]